MLHKIYDIAGLNIGLRLLNGNLVNKRSNFKITDDFKRPVTNVINIRIDDSLNPAVKGNILLKSTNFIYGYHNNEYYILLKNKKFISRFDASLNTINIAIKGKENVKHYFRTAIFLILPFLLNKYSGFMLHACAVRYCKKGLIFSGYSGSGKTTIANLCNTNGGNLVIDDDYVIIRKIKKKFIVSNLPWNKDGTTREVKKTEVDCLFFIRHGKEYLIKKLEIIEKIFEMHRHKLYHIANDDDRRRSFEVALDFIKNVPCYSLDFLPEAKLWGVIDSIV